MVDSATTSRLSPEESFRLAARRYAAGVTVVTTRCDWVADGVTVSAFTTLSLRPLLVLVAVGSEGLFLRRVLTSGFFAVNILADHQESVARYFSDPGRPRALTEFPGSPSYAGMTGAPILDGCLGYFDCGLADARKYGDHRVVVGEVRDASSAPGSPLFYYEGQYHALPI